MESVLLIFDEPVKVLEGSARGFLASRGHRFASRSWTATSVFAAPWSHGSERGRAWKCHEASAKLIRFGTQGDTSEIPLLLRTRPALQVPSMSIRRLALLVRLQSTFTGLVQPPT